MLRFSSHLEDVSMTCLHIYLAYALPSIYLCCANGVMIKIGHVTDDVLHYHAHTLFAWSLMRVGNIGGMVTSTSTTSHLSPSHDEDVLASKTTVFEGGGHVGGPTSITMSYTSIYANQPRTSMGGKELHGLQPSKACAWKRRRKRQEGRRARSSGQRYYRCASGTTAKYQDPVVPLGVPGLVSGRPLNLLYTLPVPSRYLPRSTARKSLDEELPVLPLPSQERYYRWLTGTTAACVQ